MEEWILGITGASGSPIALRMAEYLLAHTRRLHVVATDAGRLVFQQETGLALEAFLTAMENERLCLHDNRELTASIASGAGATAGMFIVPCSMATAGRLAAGCGGDLLCRAADVCLKEGRKLVLCPRESPLSEIHLRNLLTLRQAGCVICPPMPAFYSRPADLAALVDHLAGRLLKAGGIENPLYKKWEGTACPT